VTAAAVVLVVVHVVAVGVVARPLVLGAGRPRTLVGARVPASLGRVRWERRPSGRRARGDLAREVIRLRSAVAGGGSVAAAFGALAEAGGVWARPADDARRALRAGVPLDEALARWAADDPDRRLVADALAIAGATGGSQVGALDAVASTLAERQALAREIRALASQASASAVLLVATPIAFAVAVGSFDARVRSFYVSSGLGPACVLGGVALDAVGGWWMRRLVRAVR
jgi:tight adherence protein B